MNDLIQNGLVILIFAIAVSFLVRKFFWKKKVALDNKKGCSNSGCGCS